MLQRGFVFFLVQVMNSSVACVDASSSFLGGHVEEHLHNCSFKCCRTFAMFLIFAIFNASLRKNICFQFLCEIKIRKTIELR